MTLERYLLTVLRRKKAELDNMTGLTHAQVIAYKRGYAQAIEDTLTLIQGHARLEHEREDAQMNLL